MHGQQNIKKRCSLSLTVDSSTTFCVKVKKNSPITCHGGTEGGRRISILSLSNLGARWGWLVNATPSLLYPSKRYGTLCTGC